MKLYNYLILQYFVIGYIIIQSISSMKNDRKIKIVTSKTAQNQICIYYIWKCNRSVKSVLWCVWYSEKLKLESVTPWYPPRLESETKAAGSDITRSSFNETQKRF